MTIRRSKLLRRLMRSKRLRKARKQSSLHMERLEERQLLAVGPQLISIQPNRGDLLADGQIRHEPPRELLFHFQANASIDASSLPQNPESPTSSDSIQIWRSGQDGSFERASTFTDFGTGGHVVAQFTAKQIGQGGNFIALNFSESTNPQGPAVAVDTVNKQIFVELNIAQPITAAEVVTAIGDHPTASQLVDSSIIRGNGNISISGSTIADYSPVQLNGANSAKASSDFNFGTELTIEFTAVTAGPAGNGIRINVNGGDLGEVSSSPQILVDGKQIDIIVNSNELAPTTAADLVSTVNSNPFSSVLVQARILVGDPTLLVGERADGLPTMVLQGGDDVRVVPGFIGLESNTREVTLRFRDSLVDDVYLINIFGSGPQPLADVNGNPFAEGLDFERQFTLDLGPVVQSVVPQPIRRLADGSLEQARDQIDVYFNEDELDFESATDRRYYRLIFTDETATNTDDVVFHPTSLSYDPQTHLVQLTFSAPLEQLIDPVTGGRGGSGTYRLRIGTDEALPIAPSVVNVDDDLGIEPGSSFNTAVSLNDGIWNSNNLFNVTGDSLWFDEGQLFSVVDDDANERTFEFDSGFILIMPNAGGDATNGGIADGETFTISDGNQAVTFEFDNDGSLSGTGNTGISYNNGDNASVLAAKVHAEVAAAGIGLNPQVLPNGRVYLGGTTSYSLDTDNTAASQEGRPGTQTAGIIPITFIPQGGFNANQMAAAITDGINNGAFSATARHDGTRIQLIDVADVKLISAFPALSLSAQGVVLQSEIVNSSPFPLDFPGESDEPGHRNIPEQIEAHLGCATADTNDGPEQYFYNFQDEYGVVDGRVQHNAITEAQKQRAREIFEFYSSQLGVLFIESEARGLTIVTGDLAVMGDQSGPGGVAGLGAVCVDPSGGGMAIMDAADFDSTDSSLPLGSWFNVAMHEIGHMLGFGHSYELPPLTVMGSDGALSFGQGAEGVYPGDHDLVHGKHLHRPDSTDIDLYRFDVTQRGEFQAETIAERLVNASLLDSNLILYRASLDNFGRVISREIIAQNDDYFSNDSFIKLDLVPGTYYLAISSTGNDEFDPQLPDTGADGRTTGRYELRMNFRPDVDATIEDTTGTSLDGDADGIPGGVYNFWFRTAAPQGQQSAQSPKTLVVDKSEAPGGDGSLATPFNNIQNAFSAAEPDDIVRIIGNPGADGDISTLEDNLAYEIGFRRFGNTPLQDGQTLEVPRGVTLMVDNMAIIKARRARIGRGSSSVSVDRSGGSIQVLGVPRLIDDNGDIMLDETGLPLAGSVFFTSAHDNSIGQGTLADPTAPDPRPGDWGGIVLRNDIDLGEKRYVSEQNGLFVDQIQFADFRYGGGSVLVSGVSQVVTPIHLIDARPNINFNRIRLSADAAISANPDSFEETTYNTPDYQNPDIFTSDFHRVGPEIRSNLVVKNTLNGLFIRVTTPAGQDIEKMTVSGRWDEQDISVILSEALILQGQPGGPLDQTITPPVLLVKLSEQPGGTLAAGDYSYRLTYVNASGEETPASDPTSTVAVSGLGGAILLQNLPTLHNVNGFVSRRLYRSDAASGRFILAANLDAFDTSFLDTGVTIGDVLQSPELVLAGRPNARLSIDPGVVVKLDAARFETEAGATFIAEGRDGEPVIFTSLSDRSYGNGGTFNTNSAADTAAPPQPGDWAGMFFGHLSSASVDHVRIEYAGGVARIEGRFAGFNPIEIHQSEVRIAQAVLKNNADGTVDDGAGGSLAPSHRYGRGNNGPATIFIRGAQPVIVNNDIVDNEGASISINVNALNNDLVNDMGRATGAAEILVDVPENQGALVYGNRLSNDPETGVNTINGMVVRRGTVTTQSVWDDTDIVHVVNGTINVPDFHVSGGLRLESSATESLVVKLLGDEAGFTATGRPLEISDRIGGTVQIVGQPRSPVILTSLNDDTVGAGFTPDGIPQVDTNGDAIDTLQKLPTGPEVDNGTLIDNDVAIGTPGQFAFKVLDGGASGFAAFAGGNSGAGGGISAQGNTQLFSNTDAIFEFTNFVDVGINGNAIDLSQSSITQPATLVAPDLVVSEGTISGENGAIQWRLESTLEDGFTTVYNELSLTSAEPLGTLQFINYLDEDIVGSFDDLLYLFGTPGTDEYRAFTLDGPERIGFAQGGFTVPGENLINATYDGFAADAYRDLLTAIETTGTTYTPDGNIDTTDLTPFNDPKLGGVYGLADITTAFAWTVDPTANEATITSILELVPRDPALAANPGDWRSVRIDQFAHDRNVDVVLEREATNSDAGVDANAIPGLAQSLGIIAPHEQAEDENLRLGVEVHGVIASRDDVDSYSFKALPGTEVWFDIDRTATGLDTVVELVDAAGNVLAQSDDAHREAIGELPVYFNASILGDDDVHPLQRSFTDFYPDSAFGQPKDEYTLNPRDAGFRVRLPGPTGQLRTFYVRVRSSNLLPGENRTKLQDANNVDQGLTRGAYQMQVRIQERDEVPGSTVQYADIRYATNGIEVFGQPTHSPLSAEALEDSTANDTPANSQPLGNLLTSDRGTVGVSGTLDGDTDVDFYQFDAQYENIQQPGNQHVSAVFDVDYSDGLGRPDTQLWVFDANGNLVLVGERSNLADDLPAPDEQSDLDDLSRGGVGQLDPFIGPVSLPGGSYNLAVSNFSQMSREMEQFYLSNPANPLFRLEPIDTIGRIVDEHFDDPANPGTADAAHVPVILETDSIVPYALGDVSMYVAVIENNEQNATIYSFDAFTGVLETSVGSIPVPDTGLIEDIAIRPGGIDTLHAFSTYLHNLQNANDARTGLYMEIDSANASILNSADDGIETYEGNIDADPPCSEDARATNANGDQEGVGIHFKGVTYHPTTGRGYAVGSRPEFLRTTACDEYDPDVLYWFDPETGQMETEQGQPGVNDRESPNRNLGAGTQIRERGILDTGDADDQGDIALTVPEATGVTDTTTTFIIPDGAQIGVDRDGDGTADVIFEMNSGPEIRLRPNPAAGRFVRDGDVFRLDGINIEFDTGSVLVVQALTGADISDGTTLTITDDNLAGEITTTYEFNKTGGVGPGNIAIAINDGMNRAAVLQSIMNTIDGTLNFNVQTALIDNRITLFNESGTTGATSTETEVNISGSPGSASTRVIVVEETFDRDALALALMDGFQFITGVTVGVDGERVNFLGATVGDFTQIVNHGVFVDVGSDGTVSPGAIAIGFLAQDTAETIAARIANAMSGQGILNQQTSNMVILNNPNTFAFVDDPFTLGGNPPGGELTGLAFIGDDLFGVSDGGGLYRIINYDGPPQSAFAIHVPTSAGLNGIDFEGLVAGPTVTEDDLYSEMLFGIDGSGTMFAFDTTGILQPVFLDGTSSRQIFNPADNNWLFGRRVVGLAFSHLSENPWRLVGGPVGTPSGDNFQSDEPGHGDATPFDGSRGGRGGPDSAGGINGSLHMARGEVDPLGYHWTGGLFGAIETAPFSLEQYSPDDRPYVYYTYFAETEQAATPETMWDSMRVYVGGDDGTWDLISTNNSDPDTELAETINFIKEEYDDAQGWRQVRVPLTNYAGRSDLRLRFDFHTAGDWNYGDMFTTGSDLRIQAGQELRDGQTFQIDNSTFEIDSGFTVVTPSGAAIADGSTLTMNDGFQTYTLEFDFDNQLNGAGNVAVPFGADWTAGEVAESIFLVLRNQYGTPVINGNLLAESNDSIVTALDSTMDGTSQTFIGNGNISDNPNVEPTLDVDMVKLELKQGSRINADVAAFTIGSPLDAVLRVFDEAGNEVAFNDDANSIVDPVLSYTASDAGTYYVGVSGAPNQSYDARFAGSGQSSNTQGVYRLTINVTDPAGVAQKVENRVNIPPMVSIQADPASNVVVEGMSGTNQGIAISIHEGMSAEDVTRAVRKAMADEFANGILTAIKTRGNVVRVIGHTVNDAGPFGLTDALYGDVFGNFNSSERSARNDFQGIYVDNIVIGFAERGEMATGSAGLTDFIGSLDPEPNGPSTTGEYYWEMRPADLPGITGEGLTGDQEIALDVTVDTNDRGNQSLSVVTPAAFDLADGHLFRLSDGTGEVIFEFDDVTINDGVTAGHIEIDFDPLAADPRGVGTLAERDYEMAKRLRDAINGDDSRNVIRISAGLSNSTPAGSDFDDNDLADPVDLFTKDPLVNLHGTARTDLTVNRVEVTQTTADGTELVEALLGPGVTMGSSAPVFIGGVNSAGLFTGGSNSIGIEEGVALATGDLRTAEGPNQQTDSSSISSGLGDLDLDSYFAVETLDTTSLEFSINVATDSTVSIPFVFASEEYNEFVNSGFNDAFAIFVDGVNTAFVTGTNIPVSVDSVNAGNPFGSGGSNEQFYNNNAVEDNGTFVNQFGFDGFTSIFTASPFLTAGEHTVKIAISDVADTLRDSAVFLRPINTQAERLNEGLPGLVFDSEGDSNRKRDQGQIVIHSNQITHSMERGIHVDAGARDAAELPHAGPARLTRLKNDRSLVPGVVVSNNVVAFNRQVGIEYSGDSNPGTMQTAPVPFGRIVNNSVIGTRTSIGIVVSENASPTLINNIVADSAIGIQVDQSSLTTVIGATLYAGNLISTQGIGQGQFAISVPNSDSIFVNRNAGNFYLQALAPAIDSSMDSLRDRLEMKLLREPIGIAESPILAPAFDGLGQLRVDDPDVNTPSGLGGNVFVDRGAIDRADFAGPLAELVDPRDNDASGLDEDARETYVQRSDRPFEAFRMRLVDGVAPSNAALGVGIDDLTVISDAVVLSRDGQVIEEGIDYLFAYDATSDVIRLTSLAGIWETDRAYEINLTNEDNWLIPFLAGDQVSDGTTLNVADEFGNTVIFELDSGFGLQVPSGGGADLVDGMTFQLALDTTFVTFEFDSDDATFGGVPVTFTPADSADTIAESIVAAINSQAALLLTATHIGEGFVQLGGTEDHAISTGTSPLVATGQPGVFLGNVAIPYVAHTLFTGNDIAQRVTDAINANTILVGVNAGQRSAAVAITGASVVRGDRVRFISAISDLAGNSLLPNQNDGSTRVTIFLGDALDLGDAPAIYPVTKAQNGASHALTKEFQLGTDITSESDGQPSLRADADDDDGVTFDTTLIAGYQSTITVTANGISAISPGLLDAWIDFNGDGDWNDVNEQIFENTTLVNGENELKFNVRELPPGGITYARFRFSTTGGLLPYGRAEDGEVEDYLVEIEGNPWQNPRDRMDVNNDGFVSPIDPLLVINFLTVSNLPGQLPVPPDPNFQPPPYLDVSGDGIASPIDALIVIAHLNDQSSGGGEGEASSYFGPMDASLASSLTRYDSTEGDMRDTYLQQQPADEINSTRIGTDTDAFTRVDYRSLELEDMLDSIAADVDDISDSNSLWDDLLGEL